jgi:hypothetical protein
MTMAGPLHCASIYGHWIAMALIEGADVDIKDDWGTPLHFACLNGLTGVYGPS